MDDLADKIRHLVGSGRVRISEHGSDKLAGEFLSVREILTGAATGLLIELYPDFPKGPCVLLLQQDKMGKPVHTVWGIPKGCSEPAVLVTAYRPDPVRWYNSLNRRKPL